MLDPDYLQSCTDQLELIASEIETEIINAILKRIKARQENGWDYILTSSDAHRLSVLEDMGFLTEDIEKVIAEKSGLAYEEIKGAFIDAGYKTQEFDNELYQKVGLNPTDISESPYCRRLLDQAYKRTCGTFKNITKTYAKAGQQLFINTMDKVFMEIATGAKDINSAYLDAINTIANDGVIIEYPSGHKDTVETASMRALRTSIQQASNGIVAQRASENGVTNIIVSSHYDSRPSHAQWQGRVYSVSNWSDLTEIKYRKATKEEQEYIKKLERR